MTHVKLGWITNELSMVNFGDERLNRRFMSCAIRLAARPEAPINVACSTESEIKGAYRMFSNPSVVTQEILDSHQLMTAQRCRKHNLVFAIQDTSFLEFTGHEATYGLGPIAKQKNSETLGLLLHSCLMITPEGLPLGLLSQQCYARKNSPRMSRAEQKVRVQKLPIEDKESYKWLQVLQDINEHSLEGTKIVSIADREADIFEFISKATEMGGSFLVCNCFNRKTAEGNYIRDIVSQQELAGTHSIFLESRQSRKARTVKLEIRFKEVLIAPSLRNSASRTSEVSYEPVTVFLIEGKEVSKKTDALHWILLTNEPVRSLGDAIEKLNWYKQRWSIETFHKILKSGCRIESCRLQHIDRLKRYICLMSIIAIRLFQITLLSRTLPDVPCTTELTEQEWKVLYTRTHKTRKYPTVTPTFLEAVTWIAKLGGYRNRASDPPPGIIVLWRGWQVLQECVSMWDAMNILEVQRCGD